MIPLTLDEIIGVTQGHPSRDMPRTSVTGVSIDSRSCNRGDIFFAIRGRNTDGHRYVDQALERGAIAAVVMDHPVADDRPLMYVGDTVRALGRLAAYHRKQRNVQVIAVTGSNGKTTTKCMIHHILSDRSVGRAAPQSYNNAIGVPLTLLSTESKDDYLVVEIGSNAPGEVAALAALASPNMAVITSIGDAHLEGLTDRRGVAMEKSSLLDHLRPSGLAVLNADAPELAPILEGRHEYTVISFGTSDAADVQVTGIESRIDGTTFRVNDRLKVSLPCPGEHNALNAAAAFAVCRRLNVEPERIIELLSTFKPLPMRLDVSRVGGLTLIDDTYNANPSSTMAAIEVLRASNSGGRRVFVGGQMLELGAAAAAHHRGAGRQMAQAGIDLVVAIGDHAPDVICGVHSVNRRLTTVLYADTETACADLPNWLNDSDTVLIKGSRQLQLDRVARSVWAAFA